MSRIHNFSSGPAMLPAEVLARAGDEMLDWHGGGMGVMEMSHRGREFTGIAAEAERDLRELLAIPAHYKVLFLQGGATLQFAQVPMNLLRGKSGADYVLTGEWSKKAAKEAQAYCDVHVAASSQDRNFTYAPRDWQVAIVDDLGHRLPAGEPGELVARPRRPLILFDGYFEMPEETVNAWRGLWYHTGDVCREDANGVFWYLGRKRDVIRRRGQDVSTWELETLAGNHPEISEVAAFAVSGQDGEEAITLYVRRRESSSLDEESLKKYCESMLPRFMRPDHFCIEDAELPKTPSGKIDKPRLKQIFATRAGANDR